MYFYSQTSKSSFHILVHFYTPYLSHKNLSYVHVANVLCLIIPIIVISSERNVSFK